MAARLGLDVDIIFGGAFDKGGDLFGGLWAGNRDGLYFDVPRRC
jgi:hypothetical protein